MHSNQSNTSESRVSLTRLRTWLVRSGLTTLVIFIGMQVYGVPSTPVTVQLEMSSNDGERGEIFYRSHGGSYTQRDSIAFSILDDGKLHDYTIELPGDKHIDRVRIDPTSAKGEIAVYSLQIVDANGIQRFDGRGLFDARGRVNQARVEVGPNGELLLQSVGSDPYIELPLHRPANGPHPLLTALQRLFLALATSLILIGVCAGIARARIIWSRNKGDHICERAHRYDDGLMEFTPSVAAAFGLIAVSALIFIGLKLNQSSIEVWEGVYPPAPVEQAIDIGAPRHIRSDEWKVQTPWILNQVLAGSPSVNTNLGGATAPIVASVPIADPIGLPNLKYAGFRFLNIERGYSWFWSYKSFGLVFSFLWLLLILTRGNLPASIAGTAWIYFSSYTQWWFSSALPEIMTAFALGTVGALYSLYSGTRLMTGVGAALVVYAATNLALNLYPPFVVSLGYLTVAIVLGYGLEVGGLKKFWQDKGFRLTVLFVALAAIVTYGFWFFNSASGAIGIMLDTVYPGRRVSSSGGVPLSKLMSGFFEMFRLGESQFPKLPFSYNASEASGHLIMLPLIPVLVPFGIWFRRGNALLTLVAAFCVMAFAWITLELPDPLNRIMQLTGWFSVTPKRAIMSLGVGSILLCTVLLARMQSAPSSNLARRATWVTVPLIALAVAYLGWRLRQADPAFFTWQVIAIGALVSALIGVGIARGKTTFFATGVAILALPAASVNPLTSGLSSIMEKPVLQAAKRQGGASNDRWLAIGDNFFAQGLKAVGLNVMGGTHYIPDRSTLDRMDPQKRNIQVWNRYSTISLLSEPGVAAPRFELIHPDQYRIVVDVCSRTIQDLGITHVAYTTEVPTADLRCLYPLNAPADSGVRLFRLALRR